MPQGVNSLQCRRPGLIPGWEDPLEKGMATHSSILAWRIPWTEEPGGYGPWGHNESDTTERLSLTWTWKLGFREARLLA